MQLGQSELTSSRMGYCQFPASQKVPSFTSGVLAAIDPCVCLLFCLCVFVLFHVGHKPGLCYSIFTQHKVPICTWSLRVWWAGVLLSSLYTPVVYYPFPVFCNRHITLLAQFISLSFLHENHASPPCIVRVSFH
jgi:hypothetical protein